MKAKEAKKTRKAPRRCASCGAPEKLYLGYSNLTNFLGGGVCAECINRAMYPEEEVEP